MTNKERLISLLGFAPADKDNVIDGALLDEGIPGSSQYLATGSNAIKRAAVSVLKILLSTPDTTNTDGYAINWDRSAVKHRIADLESELGMTRSIPKITGKQAW